MVVSCFKLNKKFKRGMHLQKYLVDNWNESIINRKKS